MFRAQMPVLVDRVRRDSVISKDLVTLSISQKGEAYGYASLFLPWDATLDSKRIPHWHVQMA